MTNGRIALALAAAALPLSGCIAAAVPIAAAGAIGGKKVAGKRKHRDAQPAQASSDGYVQPGMTALPPPGGVASRAAQPGAPAADTVPVTMQYLYGSGEAAALSMQAYLGLMNYLLATASDQAVGHAIDSVVLAPGSTLDAPKFMPCGKKPPAIVLDVDETTLLNLGYEQDQAAHGNVYDARRWDAWERSATAVQVAPVPGVADAILTARTENVAVVFNTNRLADNAEQTARILNDSKLGPAVHGDTLWMQGDVAPGSGKDPRRWAISARYCVIAMVGDQLGDFSDVFNAGLDSAARRTAIASRKLVTLWGHGWFLLPNPVYGTGLKGTPDQIFPPATRWAPPVENK